MNSKQLYHTRNELRLLTWTYGWNLPKLFSICFFLTSGATSSKCFDVWTSSEWVRRFSYYLNLPLNAAEACWIERSLTDMYKMVFCFQAAALWLSLQSVSIVFAWWWCNEVASNLLLQVSIPIVLIRLKDLSNSVSLSSKSPLFFSVSHCCSFAKSVNIIMAKKTSCLRRKEANQKSPKDFLTTLSSLCSAALFWLFIFSYQPLGTVC